MLRDATPGKNEKKSRSVEKSEKNPNTGQGTREELQANIRRLVGVVLGRLEEGSRDRTLDQGQTRLLGSIALRALRLWQQVLAGQQAGLGPVETRVLAAKQRLVDVLDWQRRGGVENGEETGA